MGPGDATLVRHTLRGNRDAFGRLVDRYKGLVFGIILNKIRDFDTAQDLCQDTFVEAYVKLSNLKDPSRFSSWLYGIASNMCMRWLSKAGRIVRAEELTGGREIEVGSAMDRWIQDRETPESLYEKQETVEAMWAALDTLPEEYREVIVLYHLENRSKKEIASFLDVSVGTVRGRLDRGRIALRRRLVDMDLLGRELRRRKPDRQFTTKVMAALPPLGAMTKLSLFSMLGWVEYVLIAMVSVCIIGISTWMLGVFESSDEEGGGVRPGSSFKVRLYGKEARAEEKAERGREKQLAPPAETPRASDLERRLTARFEDMLAVEDAPMPEAPQARISTPEAKGKLADLPQFSSVFIDTLVGTPERTPPGVLAIKITMTSADLYVAEYVAVGDSVEIQRRPLLASDRRAIVYVLRQGLIPRLASSGVFPRIQMIGPSQSIQPGVRHLLRISIDEPTMSDMRSMIRDVWDIHPITGFMVFVELVDLKIGKTIWTFRMGFHGAIAQHAPSSTGRQLGPLAWNRTLDHIGVHVLGMVRRAFDR